MLLEQLGLRKENQDKQERATFCWKHLYTKRSESAKKETKKQEGEDGPTFGRMWVPSLKIQIQKPCS